VTDLARATPLDDRTVGAAAQPRLRALLAVCIVALGLVLFDVIRIFLRADTLSPFPLLAYALASLGLAALCLTVTSLLRAELRLWLSRLPGAPLLHGALDGLGVWLIAVQLGRPATIRGGDKLVVLGVLLACGVAAGVFAARTRRLAHLASVAVIASALAFDAWLPYREYAWMRVCLGTVIVAACARLLSGLPSPQTRRLALIAALACASALALAEPLLRTSAATRSLLQRQGTQGAAFARVLWILSDVDGDGAPSGLGAWDCAPFDPSVFPAAHETPGDGVDSNCRGGDGRPLPRPRRAAQSPSTPAGGPEAHPSARRADVLILGLDSLRFDIGDALAPLRKELGPLAELTRAVSPSPVTLHSLSSMLRGRAMREVRFTHDRRFSRAPLPRQDRSTTLATVFDDAGYRSLAVPTHRYLVRDSGVLAGFELLDALGVDGLFNVLSKLRSASPIVTTRDATQAMLDAARDTPPERPIIAFMHAMETHEPYRWGDGQRGPLTPAALRRSVTETAHTYAALVRQWTALRGALPLVVVFGDHGEEFGEHGGRFHGTSVYSEQVHVVFWIAGPGVPTGRFDGPASTTALPATLCEMVGLTPAPTMSVPSLLPALRGDAPFPELAVSELRYEYRQSVGYTGARYRLIRDPVNDLEELYDSRRDPKERHDIAVEQPGELARMRELARRWDESH
jgi:hypothetical protein